MAEEFNNLVRGLQGTGVTMEEAIGSGKPREQKQSDQMKQVGQMFVKAQKQVQTEQSKLSDEKVFKELSKIDKGFEDYAQNLSELSVMLERMTDPNYKMNKQESSQMQELLEANKGIMGSIQKRADTDDEFKKQFEEIQKRNNVELREQGIIEEEQMKAQKRMNTDSRGLWSSINDNISTLSTDVMSDLKTDLVEGIGGPYASMTRQVLLPLMSQIKNSKVSQVIGEKLSSLGGSIKGMFGKGAVDEQEVGQEVGDELDTQTEELLVPDQADIRKRAVREERVQAPLERKKQRQGVFRKIEQEQTHTSQLLGDILNEIRSDMSDMEDMQEQLAKSALIEKKTLDLSEQERDEMGESQDKMNDYLKDILSKEEVEAERQRQTDEINQDLMEREVEAVEDTDDYRDADLYVKNKMLDELEDISEKSGRGGGVVGALLKIAGVLAGIAAIVGGSLLKRRSERKRLEDEVLAQNRLTMAERVGGDVGQELTELVEKEQSLGGETALTNDLILREQLQEEDPELRGMAMEEAMDARRRELSELIKQRQRAEAAAIKQLHGTGQTDEGKTVIPFEALAGLDIVRDRGDLKDLLSAGDIAVQGTTRPFGIGRERQETIDIDDSFLKGLNRFEQGEGVNLNEEFGKRLEGQLEEEDVPGLRTGGVVMSEGLYRIAEDTPEVVTPVDDYLASASVEDTSMDDINRLENEVYQTKQELRESNQVVREVEKEQKRSRTGNRLPKLSSDVDSRKGLNTIPVVTDNLGLLLINSGKMFT